MKQWLAQINMNNPKGPALDVTKPSFSRATLAYDPLTGAQYANNTMRYGSGPFGPAGLFEYSTTNLMPNPAGDSLTGWIGTNSSVLSLQATSPGGSFPPGMTSCIKNTLTTVDGITTPSALTLATNTQYTLSIWCYVPSSVPAGVAWIYIAYVNVGYVSFNNVMVTERNAWVEKVITFTSNATYAAHVVGLAILAGSIGQVHYCTKIQLEATAYRSSWTRGTRNTDNLYFNTSGVLSMSDGCIEMWVSPTVLGNWHGFFGMTIGTGRRFLIVMDIVGRVTYDHGVTNTSITSANSTVAVGRWTHIAIRWSSSVGTRELFVNGLLVGSLAYTPGTDAFPATASVFSSGPGAYVSNLHIGEWIPNATINERYRAQRILEMNPSYEGTNGEVTTTTTLSVPMTGDYLNRTPTGSDEILWVCSGPSFCTKPTDSPPNTCFLPRISQPALTRREIPIPGVTSGTVTRISYGELVLSNADGLLDYLAGYDFSNRMITIYSGSEGAPFPAGFTKELVATVDSVRLNLRDVSVKIKSHRSTWEQPVNSYKYLGNNASGLGVEGDASLKDTAKPLVIGTVYNMIPTMVNSAKLVYQYNVPGVCPIITGYPEPALSHVLEGGGLPITRQYPDYASKTEMETTAPTSGYKVWPAGGCFRMAAAPIKKLTCGVGAYNSYYALWPVLNAIVRGPGGYADNGFGKTQICTPALYLSGSIDDWSIACYGRLIADNSLTVAQLMDELTQSACLWWGFKKTGELVIGKYDGDLNNYTAPVATITNDHVISIERDVAPTHGKATFSAQHNYAVLGDSDFVGGASAENRQYLARTWITTQLLESSTPYPFAAEFKLETMTRWPIYGGGSNPGSEWLWAVANAGGFREVVKLTLNLDSTIMSSLDLGTMVLLKMPRLGYRFGKRFLVCSIQTDPVSNKAELTLWG